MDCFVFSYFRVFAISLEISLYQVEETLSEDADPVKVIAAVRAVGLDRYSNTSYTRGLKEIMGL